MWESLFVDIIYGSFKKLWKFWHSWWSRYTVIWTVREPGSRVDREDGETRGQWLRRKVYRWKTIKTPQQRMAKQRDEGAKVANVMFLIEMK